MRTVTEICDSFVDRMAQANPMLAGRVLGVGRGTSAVTDWSVAGAEQTAQMMRETLAELEATAAVTRSEELGAGFLADTCRAALRGHEEQEYLRRMSTSLFMGPPAMLLTSFDLMERHSHGETPVDGQRHREGWESILGRLQAVPAAIAGYRESLEAGLAADVVADRRMTLAVADQCNGWASAGFFTAYVASHGDGALAASLAAAARAADGAYAELAAWLRETYAPRAAHEDGVGADRYRTYCNLWLGLADLDLDEAYAWAAEDYRRLEGEKRIEAARIRPGATPEEVQALLDADPAHRMESADAFQDWAADIIGKTMAALDGREIDIPDQLRTCPVQMVAEGAGAMPFYLGPPEGFAKPGSVVWPTLGKTSFATWSALTTVFHESVPGHHTQLGGSRLLDLTRIQRVGAAAGHCEGWAMYAERLMDELGWFDTPATRLGFLNMQAFRAARVVVDIGLHTRRRIPEGFAAAGEPWTFERAVAAIMKASGFPRASATLEVERYLAWPAQATCYKLGERIWMQARHEAMARHGSGFDRRKWHMDALALGPLGLDRLLTESRKL